MHEETGLRLIELPTLIVIFVCYAAFGVSTTILAEAVPLAGFVLLTLAITLHSSLQHEILHGHFSRNRFIAVAMVFPAIGLFIPYERFRDTHLEHHQNETLTDPYDDPESNYLDPAVWQVMPSWQKAVFSFNNTLCGRMLIGPAISLVTFWRLELRSIMASRWHVIRAYIMHGLGVLPVVLWLAAFGKISAASYLLACYGGISLLKVRTFLEHQAHENSDGRTVIIEDRGLFAFLFLNNNLHALHHENPNLPWFELPRAFRQSRAEILDRNNHYIYRSYGQIFRRYFFRSKDQVAHPLR